MDAEKIYKELTEIKVTQSVMTEDLKHHIKRTELLEDALLPIRNAYDIGKWVVATAIGTISIIGTILKVIDILKR